MLAPLVLSLHLTLTAGAGVYALPQQPFVEQAKADLATLRIYSAGLRRLQGQIRHNPELFERRGLTPYSPDEKRLLLTTWGAYFSYIISAESLRQRYWEFFKLPPNDVRHGLGFIITHLALTTELSHGLAFADLAVSNPALSVLLDEPSAEYGVPPRAFTQLKETVIRFSTVTQLITGDTYLAALLPRLKKTPLLSDPNLIAALDETRASSQIARQGLVQRGANLFIRNAADVIKLTTLTALFPIQKNVAEWAGDTRVHRHGKPLIKREQSLELLEKMEPGDILVARQNWFLSNVGLPGFWPHAELYLGTADELTRYFDGDAGMTAWLATLPGAPKSFAAHLSKRFPEKWKAYQLGKDYLGFGPIRIIESISEGVSFTSVEHGMGVDYLGVMRPRLGKVEKAKAILRAFGYHGRPYDFDFDFASDSTLVCTELVYKSYCTAKDMKGLEVPLVDVAGRMTLPANELVKMFDREYGAANRQLDFVAFLDGKEREGVAVSADVETFRKSHQRVKWDVAQK